MTITTMTYRSADLLAMLGSPPTQTASTRLHRLDLRMFGHAPGSGHHRSFTEREARILLTAWTIGDRMPGFPNVLYERMAEWFLKWPSAPRYTCDWGPATLTIDLMELPCELAT